MSSHGCRARKIVAIEPVRRYAQGWLEDLCNSIVALQGPHVTCIKYLPLSMISRNFGILHNSENFSLICKLFFFESGFFNILGVLFYEILLFCEKQLLLLYQSLKERHFCGPAFSKAMNNTVDRGIAISILG